MTGEEVLKYLEYSYSGWYNTMDDPNDHLLKFRTDKNGNLAITEGKAWLKNQAYNFDSAAGIDYNVDVSKPEGSRISVKGFSNGGIFDLKKTYHVAVNSFRGNGGGGHFYEGVGLVKSDLLARIIKSTDRDLRYYMIESIKNMKIVNPEPLNNWIVLPEKYAEKAAVRDYELLFGEESK